MCWDEVERHQWRLTENSVLFKSLQVSHTLQWHYNGCDGISHHQPHHCLPNRLYWGAGQRKHQSSTSLAFVQGIHRWPVNSLHKWPVRRIMFTFDDVIMQAQAWSIYRVGAHMKWIQHWISTSAAWKPCAWNHYCPHRYGKSVWGVLPADPHGRNVKKIK